MKKKYKGYFKKPTNIFEDIQDRKIIESLYGVKPHHQNVFKARRNMENSLGIHINFEKIESNTLDWEELWAETFLP